MKNFIINGFSKLPTGKITNNQTIMCIINGEDGNVILVKTSDKYYKMELDTITNEEFEGYFKVDDTTPVEDVPFHTRFQITSDNLSLGLPIDTDSVTVDWGDGVTNNEQSHTYATAGTYDVKITGEIRDWEYTSLVDTERLLEIVNWGTSFIITNKTKFGSCRNLILNNVVGTPIILATDLSFIFADCSSLTSINNINHWDTSNVTNMYGMFNGCVEFNQPLSFDTSNVTNMNGMFSGCVVFNQPLSFDTSNVTDMNGMFADCVVFNQPLSFDTSNVTNMNNMFAGCTEFNQPLSFDTTNVTDMTNMFYACTVFNQPLSFDTSNVTNMYGMFAGCVVFNQDLSTWSVDNVISYTNFDMETPSWVSPKPSFNPVEEAPQ